MINLLSWEKKKKLPLLPCDSPALNTISLFSSGLKLFLISSLLRLSSFLKNAKAFGEYSVMCTSSLITRMFSSSSSGIACK